MKGDLRSCDEESPTCPPLPVRPHHSVSPPAVAAASRPDQTQTQEEQVWCETVQPGRTNYRVTRLNNNLIELPLCRLHPVLAHSASQRITSHLAPGHLPSPGLLIRGRYLADLSPERFLMWAWPRLSCFFPTPPGQHHRSHYRYPVIWSVKRHGNKKSSLCHCCQDQRNSWMLDDPAGLFFSPV